VSELELEDRVRFEQLVLSHLDAAFNLARWLLRGRADAEDVAQEALLRACRFFRGFHGGDTRAWLLQIVRNTCYTWLEKNRPLELSMEFDEEIHLQNCATPETLAIAGDDRERLILALETLPPRFREVLVLRELEGHWYRYVLTLPCSPPVAVRIGKLLEQGGYPCGVTLLTPCFRAISTVS
jgi:RNA polymerase sigma factor (sigma-70 family)